MKSNNRIRNIFCVIVLLLVFFFCLDPSSAKVDKFLPKQGGTTEIWRITHDPTMRDWANYHNTDAWSPDGRYICFIHYDPYETVSNSEIHIYDLHLDKEIRIDTGSNPRWATNHNWLFYVRRSSHGGSPRGEDAEVMWLDVDNNKLTRIARGVTYLGETDSDDRWLYGSTMLERRRRLGVRMPIREDSRPEIIDTVTGIFWIPNPEHPSIMIRFDHGDPNATDRPFESTRTFCDLEGRNVTIGSPMLQRCHQGWSGDGKYLMHGSPPMSGRLWNEPFPSNLHIISSISCGDISPCGRSGRWVSGSSNQGPLQIADLRSGDGYNYLKAALSFIHDSDKFGYCYGSALEDNDAKGSADGTKIVFVTNYDLKNGPMTVVTENISGDSKERIPVESTDGFPESGRLSAGNEVVGYARKTPTSFERLTRGLYNTTATNLEYLTPALIKEYKERSSDEEFIKKRGLNILRKMQALYSKRAPNIRKGLRVSSFDFRVIPKEKRKVFSPTSRFTQDDFPDKENLNSPMPWQNRTDIHVAVVRLPDQPHIRKVGDELELIPGENHWETYGYHIYKGGKRITDQPLRPGTFFALQETGTYTAVAVEWSGLQSLHSFHIQIKSPIKLRIRYDKPADFSWTSDRWLVNDKEVSKEEAARSEEAVREIVHLIEGVMHREWYNWGQITKRYDLIM